MVATVTTTGHCDVVPVTNVGRIVALIYMFFGITLIATVMAVITNTFYRKEIIKDEELRKEEELKYLRKILFEKLQDIEKSNLSV